MKKYVTEISAISPITGELTTYVGPEIPGISFEDAENYREKNGLGYCKIIGELIAEIPCKKESFEPDWKNQTDYETITNN